MELSFSVNLATRIVAMGPLPEPAPIFYATSIDS
jgi:hypothetical protein